MGVLGGPRVLDAVLSCVRVREQCACNECVRLRVCAHLCVCVHLCACALRACARKGACMRAFVSACAWVRAFPSDRIFARACVASVCVCSERVCSPRRCARPPIARRRLVVSIARPAPRVCVCAWSHRPGSRVLAAGVSFTNRALQAEWAARYSHTSVIDAISGAIYVIGGYGQTTGSRGTYETYFQDVWASTDGGARPDSVRGGRGVLKGVLKGVLTGTKGY